MNTAPNVTIRWDRVRLLRQMRELDTDYKLANAMGMSQGSLSRTLRGLQAPGPRFIAGLCTALGATMNDLFEIVTGQDVAA